LLAFAAGTFMPWWSIALVSFVIAMFMYQKPGMAYLSGFAGILLLWGALAYWIDMQNEHILSRRMAELFPLHGSSNLLMLITALVGAIIGGLVALSGCFLRRYVAPYWLWLRKI